jgi:CRISPR-associated protein Csm1
MTSTKESTRDIVYLAALLHDIGKFWQRGDGFWSNAKALSEETRKLAFVISNTSQNNTPTHQHVYWTNEFLLQNKKKFQAINLWEDTKDSLINLAANHHKPASKLQGLITLADHWASGMDRTKIPSEESDEQTKIIATKDINFGKYQFLKMPLTKIFYRVLIEKETSQELESKRKTYPISPLSLEQKTILGSALGKEAKELVVNYKTLWKQFEQELELIPTQDVKVLSKTLLALLRKYTWCIPADTSTLFDSSLYEHLKITAALALCIYDYEQENPSAFTLDNRNHWKIGKGFYPLRLWCIDLSGIQKFIYDISSKYAAKSLKGRSFYLQLLLDGISDFLIAETEVHDANLIYSSGGKFFLLLPNTVSANETMKNAEKKLKAELFEKFALNLFICFGSVAWSYDNSVNNEERLNVLIDGEKEAKTLGDLWQMVTQSASEQKQQKYKEKLLEPSDLTFQTLFGGNLDAGGNTEICAVTGEEGKKLQSLDDGNYVTKEVKQQILIGSDLKDFKHLLMNNRLKNGHQLLDSLQKVVIGSNNKDHETLTESHVVSIPQGADINFLNVGSSQSNAQSFKFYGGSDVAVLGDKPKTFEELAGIIRKNRGNDESEVVERHGNYNKIGVLRMDVDGLGKLFTHGFQKKYSSFSAYTTLSGSLDWFFSGYLNTIRRQDEFRDWVNIIYSGGDDIFAVGRWDKTIAFADEVQQEFIQFTGRPELSISGGLAIISPKFPIGKAAEMAGNAEDAAKDFTREIDNKTQIKNALCLFEIPVGWEEFEAIKIWKNKLVNWLNNKIISKGLLMKLFSYYEIHKQNIENEKKGEKPDLSWKWNAAYQIARQAKDTSDQKKKDALHELKNLIFTEIDKNNTFRFEALIVACRWAELEHRDKL